MADPPADTAARLATFDALLTPLGTELLAVAATALADGSELPTGTRLRAAGHPADLVAAAFSQAELRARARAKFPGADRMFFTRAGLEQASAHRAAAHRAARFAGLGRLADLCTGIGGDLIALAAGHPVLAVDRDPLHLRMAVHNARTSSHPAELTGAGGPTTAGSGDGVGGGDGGDGGNGVGSGNGVGGAIEPCEADVRDVDLSGVSGVFVDPARRGGDRRLATGSCEPPLPWCFGLTERVDAVAIKAAPGLRVDLVPPGWEIEFVADRRGLKEAVLFSPALATTSRRATVFSGGEPGQVATLTGDPDGLDPDGLDPDSGDSDGGVTGERPRPSRHQHQHQHPRQPLPVRPPGAFVLDPNPAVTRAGLVGTLGRRVDAWQIDPRIAFLAVDRPAETPFARVLRVEADMPFDLRRVAAAVRAAGISALDIRRRGLAGDVETIRRRLLPARRHLVPHGPAMTVIMTRVQDEPWALLCTDVPPADQHVDAPTGKQRSDAPTGRRRVDVPTS